MNTITLILTISTITAILTWLAKQIIIKTVKTQLRKPYNPNQQKYNHWLYYDILSIIQYLAMIVFGATLIITTNN